MATDVDGKTPKPDRNIAANYGAPPGGYPNQFPRVPPFPPIPGHTNLGNLMELNGFPRTPG